MVIRTYVDISNDGMSPLDRIPEIRICCGFRENMIQESTKPFDEVDFKWLG